MTESRRTATASLNGTPASQPQIALTCVLYSEIPYHHGAPHLDGYDWLLPHNATATCSSATEHAEVRSYRYATLSTLHKRTLGALLRHIRASRFIMNACWLKYAVIAFRCHGGRYLGCGLTSPQYENRYFSSRPNVERNRSIPCNMCYNPKHDERLQDSSICEGETGRAHTRCASYVWKEQPRVAPSTTHRRSRRYVH